MRFVPNGWRFEIVAIAVLVVTGAGIGAVIAGGASGGGNPQTPVVTGQLVFKGDELTLAAEPGQVIEGSTTRPPGTTLTVVFRSTADHGFIMARETTVGTNGGFTTTFDLRRINPHQEATLSVYAGEVRIIGPIDVIVVAEAPAGGAGADHGVTEIQSIKWTVAGVVVVVGASAAALLAARR